MTFTELESWQRVTERKLDSWELKALLAMDNAYIRSQQKPKGK